MGGAQFSTRPLEVWAGTGPRSSASQVRLPEQGFRTVSLRFTPDAAGAFLDTHAAGLGPLADIARAASEQVVAMRLAPLDSTAAQIVEAMLATPYVGAARRLFLESCALALLAAQMDAVSRRENDRHAANPSPSRERLMKARTLLDQNFADPPSIVVLARLVGINEFKLKREFKQLFGTTVFGYVRQRRMERAAVDLHAGLSVAEAAAAVGYGCPRCFADAFRRHFGVLPSEVTRRTLAKLPRTAD